MGLLTGRVGRQRLREARLRLLKLLREAYGEEASAVTVVFDAATARPGASGEEDYQGLRVLYAIAQGGKEDYPFEAEGQSFFPLQADDVIESLIRSDSTPQKLTVVSDDHRIQRAAKRRRCNVLGCQSFMDLLTDHRRKSRKRPTTAAAKPADESEAEAQRWLREFGNLQDDRLKQLSDPQEFLDI
jgi:hypothetical protein